MSKKNRFAILLIFTFILQSSFVQAQSYRYFNERSAFSSIRLIHSAQATYQSTYGNGNYGSLTDLYQAEFIDRFLWTGIKRQYNFAVFYQNRTENTPAAFYSTATPISYGKASRISFFIDETGVLRGADKNGQPADQNDPPINF